MWGARWPTISESNTMDPASRRYVIALLLTSNNSCSIVEIRGRGVLGPNVTDFYARQRQVRRQRPDLHDERVRTVVLARYEKPRHDDRVRCSLAQACAGDQRTSCTGVCGDLGSSSGETACCCLTRTPATERGCLLLASSTAQQQLIDRTQR